MVRTARSLGLAGYPQLRLALAASGAAHEPAALLTGSLEDSADLATVVATLAAVETEAITATARTLDVVALAAAADAVHTARVVDCYGIGASGLLAADFDHKAARVGLLTRRGLFARQSMVDTFKKERIPSTFNWEFSPRGQHIELGIAENNLFLMLAALGLAGDLFGARLMPVGTLYDPFIARGLDALNYACYMDARFMLVATPSGVTLAPEGGAHQSIGTPLIGLAQDGLASFEPAFVDE